LEEIAELGPAQVMLALVEKPGLAEAIALEEAHGRNLVISPNLP